MFLTELYRNGTKFLTTNRTYAVFTCVCPGVCGTGLEDSQALWKAERKILLSCTTWGLNCIKELPVTLLVNLLKVKRKNKRVKGRWRNLRQRTGGTLVFSDSVMLKQFLLTCWMFFHLLPLPPFICPSILIFMD